MPAPEREMSYRFAFGRPPAVAAEGMVATSQPLATRAGLRALERGGNAADAALAAAAVLCVTEPMSTGIGGDCFAQVWRDGELEGLDSAGPAPASADAEPVAETGPRSVTVPGAVAGWAAFAERYCRLGLDGCLEDAIDAAERGFAVSPRTAASWSLIGGPLGDPPAVGDVVYQPELGVTLRRIADEGPSGVLHGRGRGGDLRGLLAGGGRSRRLRAALGRAAPPDLQGDGGLRAAAAHAGRLRARGARAAGALVAVPREPDPLRPARARGRPRARARRRRRGRADHARVPRRPAWPARQ